MKRYFLFVVFLAWLASCSAHACRPLTVDDCAPADQGKLGFETGIASANLSGYDKNMVELTSVKFGILKNVDIGLDLPYQSFAQSGAASVSGLGDVMVKTKINIIPAEENSVGFTIVAGAKLANGDTNRGLGTGSTDYSINSIVTRELKRISLHLNLGYTFIGQVVGQALKNVTTYGCAFEAPLLADASLLGEIYGSTNPDPTSSTNPLAVTLGAKKEIFSGLVADGGFSIGLNDAAPKNIIMVGLTSEL